MKLLLVLFIFMMTCVSCSSRRALHKRQVIVPKGYLKKETSRGIYFVRKEHARLPYRAFKLKSVSFKDEKKKRSKERILEINGNKKIKTKITNKHDAILVD